MGSIAGDGDSFVVADLRTAGVLYDPAWTAKREVVLRAMAETRRVWLLLVCLAVLAEVFAYLALGGFEPAGVSLRSFVLLVSLPLLLGGVGIFAWRYFQGLNRQLANLNGADGLLPAVLAAIYFTRTYEYLICLKCRGQKWFVRYIPEEKLVVELALAGVTTPFKVVDLWERTILGAPPIDLDEVGEIRYWAEQILNEPPADPVPFDDFTKPVIG